MTAVEHAPGQPDISPGQASAAQQRVIAAALGLFAEHGINGTSLQMIATALGVSKAAVYHQFPSKDEIVLAVAEVELRQVEAALDAAEAAEDSAAARDALLTGLIDIAVARRHTLSVLQGDPAMIRFLAEHEPFQKTITRLYWILLGGEGTEESLIPAAMVTGAIGGAVLHPLVVDLDDETLRKELLRLARRLMEP
jgi:AcrR family transcriptional regulator